MRKMHDGEADIDITLVRRLLATQLPHLVDLPVEAIQSTGTVNAIFRIGDDLCARLPRIQRWVAALEKEIEWLPKLAPHLSLAVPEPVAKGEPESGYPFPWAVYRWINSDTFASDHILDERQAGADLAMFVAELRRIEISGAPHSGRKPLRQLDSNTRAAIESMEGTIDTDAATAAWDICLRAPEWNGRPVWRHCDLLPPNLLVENGNIKAILDFGGAGIGDPAIDVVAAWSVFGKDGRDTFLSTLNVDDGTWARGRGFALHQALLIIPYYHETNPAFVAMAKRTVREIIADLRL